MVCGVPFNNQKKIPVWDLVNGQHSMNVRLNSNVCNLCIGNHSVYPMVHPPLNDNLLQINSDTQQCPPLSHTPQIRNTRGLKNINNHRFSFMVMEIFITLKALGPNHSKYQKELHLLVTLFFHGVMNPDALWPVDSMSLLWTLRMLDTCIHGAYKN